MGATYYVDQSHAEASDSNAGTAESLPWLTLKKATDTAIAGDTVVVKAGTYQDSAASATHPYPAYNPVHNGSAGSPITFKSEPALAAVIKPRGWTGTASTGYMSWGLETASYITIDGFRIIGGFRASGSDHITIQNCELIEGFYPPSDPSLNWGIAFENSSNGLIKNNYVHSLLNPSSYYYHNESLIMIFGDSDNNIIENNSVDGGGYIYTLYGQKGGKMANNVWRYNFGINSNTGFQGMGSTDRTYFSESNTYYQNIIVDCLWGFDLDHNSKDFTAYNNTFYNVARVVRGGNEGGNSGLVFFNNLIHYTTYMYDDDGGTEVDTFISMDDYNKISDDGSVVYYRRSYSTLYTDLAAFVSGTSFGDHSTTGYDAGFTSPGGATPESYKRSEYPNDGRGGDYPSVVGAYISGSEIIGVTSTAAIRGCRFSGVLSGGGVMR